MKSLALAMVYILLAAAPAQAFTLIYQGGGTQPWQPQYAIKIEEGEAVLLQYSALVEPDDVDPETLTLATVPFTKRHQHELLQALEEAKFFEAVKDHPETILPDEAAGTYATIFIDIDDQEYRLSADNATVPELNAAIFALQKLFPAYPLPIPREVKKRQ